MDQPKSDEDILIEAAQAAARLKPALEAERMSKLAELEAINRRLNGLQAVIDAAPFGKPPTEDIPEQVASFIAVVEIDRVLINGPLSVPELRIALNNAYAMSTLYALLQKGKKAGYYINENATWGLSEAAMRKVKAQ